MEKLTPRLQLLLAQALKKLRVIDHNALESSIVLTFYEAEALLEALGHGIRIER